MELLSETLGKDINDLNEEQLKGYVKKNKYT